jgi:outer membrane protein
MIRTACTRIRLKDGVRLAAVAILWSTAGAVLAEDRTDQAPRKTETMAAAPQAQVLTLAQCLETSMQHNRSRPASRFAVAVAEAQHRQALAGYWPQVTAKAGYFRLDESPNFIFPASTMYVPAQTVSVPAGTAIVTIPADAFLPGFPAAPIQMPVSFPGQSITTAAQVFPIPEQNVKLLNPDNFTVSGNLTWLLYDGGMRKGYREQALGAASTRCAN